MWNELLETIQHHTAEAINQMFYPLSAAKESLLYAEIDRMLAMDVFEEAPYKTWQGKILFRCAEVERDDCEGCASFSNHEWAP